MTEIDYETEREYEFKIYDELVNTNDSEYLPDDSDEELRFIKNRRERFYRDCKLKQHEIPWVQRHNLNQNIIDICSDSNNDESNNDESTKRQPNIIKQIKKYIQKIELYFSNKPMKPEKLLFFLKILDTRIPTMICMKSPHYNSAYEQEIALRTDVQILFLFNSAYSMETVLWMINDNEKDTNMLKSSLYYQCQCKNLLNLKCKSKIKMNEKPMVSIMAHPSIMKKTIMSKKCYSKFVQQIEPRLELSTHLLLDLRFLGVIQQIAEKSGLSNTYQQMCVYDKQMVKYIEQNDQNQLFKCNLFLTAKKNQ